MAKPKRKTEREHTFQGVLDFIDLVDTAFERLTGAKISDRLKEASSQPRALPPENEPAPAETGMSLADAYSILGLKPDAPPELVKKHYRNLAKLFHTDTGGMNDEAMKLLNKSYARILNSYEERGGKN